MARHGIGSYMHDLYIHVICIHLHLVNVVQSSFPTRKCPSPEHFSNYHISAMLLIYTITASRDKPWYMVMCKHEHGSEIETHGMMAANE